ncbi:MhpC Predicted hydrolases or acyltransferases (alpha/beta hydrolase superfamily) [Acidimicrobiia bacterium]
MHIAFDIGTGPPVLLHPSLGRSVHDFDGLANALDHAGFRVVGLEPGGVEPSDPARFSCSLADFAMEVIECAGSIELDRFVVLGHAFGNRIMRNVASYFPDRVNAIVLLGAGGKFHGDPEARAAVGATFDATLSGTDRLAAISTAFFAPGNDPAVWIDGWYPAARDVQQAALIAAEQSDWWLAEPSPMLIVQGLQDRAAPPANGQALLEERMGPTTLVELDNCGHAMLPEQPELIASAVGSFLMSLSLES